MIKHAICDLLSKLGARQLLIGVEGLSSSQLQDFLSQLQRLDPHLLLKQKKLLLQPPTHNVSQCVPCCHFERSGNVEDRKEGEELIRQGKVGCLILAGGQGTRLGIDGPKGIIPVTLIKKKSLFQLFCERTKAASTWAGQELPLCIMTSQKNHEQTVEFLKAHHYFGLHPTQLSFFTQEMLPFLDDSGNWLLERPGKIAEGPDGNGNALHHFFKSGLWQQWKEAGVEYLSVIFVDNALADPFDPEFVGLTARYQADAALKAVERLSPDEKMGVLAECGGKLKVIEYSEIPSSTAPFTLSSTGMFCISMEFIRHFCQDLHADLPLHLARKKAQVLLGTAKGYVQETANVWKCERFIFDLLDYVRTSVVLVCQREKIYAPLKNAVGDRDLESVQQALLLHDRQLYQEVTGKMPPDGAFELDPVFRVTIV